MWHDVAFMQLREHMHLLAIDGCRHRTIALFLDEFSKMLVTYPCYVSVMRLCSLQ
jgi:hypothetical protein